MAWIDKPGKCEVCGRPIILKSSRHKWCRECAEEMNKIHRIQNKDERKRREREYRAGKDPDWWKGKETECKVKGSCMYGSQKFCEYMTITGRSRLLDGYPIEGGRCGAFKKGKHRGAKVGLPETAPVLGPGKLGEI